MIESKIEDKTIANKFESLIFEMEEKIEKGNKNIVPQLCFCRKYQNSGKANYIVYRANMLPEVSRIVANILKNNINNLKDKREVDDLDDNLEDCYSAIGLEEIVNWQKVEDKIFNLSVQKLDDLKKLKNNLNSFIIYYKFDNKLIGQIRRITPSSVLDQKGFLRLSFDNNTFNDIKDDKDVTIDKYYDFMFLVEFEEKNKETKKQGKKEDSKNEKNDDKTIKVRIIGLGIINNYDNFCSIFDINEQYEEEAREIIKTCDIFDSFKEPTKIIEMIEKDRTLQRTLRNPVCKDAFKSIELKHIKEIKTELGKNVKFDLKGDEIVLPSKNEKKALKEFIRSVGLYYNKSIYGDPKIVEAKPLRVL